MAVIEIDLENPDRADVFTAMDAFIDRPREWNVWSMGGAIGKPSDYGKAGENGMFMVEFNATEEDAGAAFRRMWHASTGLGPGSSDAAAGADARRPPPRR